MHPIVIEIFNELTSLFEVVFKIFVDHDNFNLCKNIKTYIDEHTWDIPSEEVE